MATAGETVLAYLDAFTSGDTETARGLVTDDFAFHGPMAQIDGADAFFEVTAPLKAMTKGYNLIRQWEDGDDVCTVYEFLLETPAGSGGVFMSEWNVVREGKLASARLVFDTAEFNALMPQ